MRLLLLSLIDQAYDHRSWHGTNLRGSLRGVSADEAAWRPAPGRHNIWELVVHAAYWKYAIVRRLTGQKRGSFPIRGSNWFERPEEVTDAAWRADLQLLEGTHRALRDAVANVPAARLTVPAKGNHDANVTWLITGIASHDLYHAGQIQLLKRLRSRK
jgi:hypothetical protein